MAARSKARRRALDVLFEADLRGRKPADVLVDVVARRQDAGQPPISEYAIQLVAGVAENSERIDELLSTYAIGWTLDRMPAVDRNILRLATYELLQPDTAPEGVVISEAVAMASELSTDDSPRFINGLLSRVARLHGETGASA